MDAWSAIAAGLAGAADHSIFSASRAMALVTQILTPIASRPPWPASPALPAVEDRIDVAWADAV